MSTLGSFVPKSPSLTDVELRDRGMIGCDFLLEKHDQGEKQSFVSHPFNIKQDRQIGRCLPLPPKKVELGASATHFTTPKGILVHKRTCVGKEREGEGLVVC